MRAGLLALAILLIAPSVVAAEPDAGASSDRPSSPARERVTLTYRVPAACADVHAFSELVTARTRRAELVTSEATVTGARRFIVEIRRHGPNYVGRLVIEASPDGGHGPPGAVRELTSPHCADLVRAFALFTAIAIDPEAGSAQAAPTNDSPTVNDLAETPDATNATPTAAVSATGAGPPSLSPGTTDSPRATTLPAAARRASPDSGPGAAPRGRRWKGSLGSGVFVAGGVADSLITSVHPVIGLSSKGPLLSPSVRLGLVWANSNTQRAGTAELVLGLRLLVLSGCLLRVPLGEGAGLRLCAALEGGVLTAQPFAIELPRAITKAWFAADPLARLEIPLLRSLLTLEIEAGIAVPFQQLRTYVNPGPIVSDAGSVGLRLGADVVLQAF